MPEIGRKENPPMPWWELLKMEIHTGDILSEGTFNKEAGTQEFAQGRIERFRQKPI